MDFDLTLALGGLAVGFVVGLTGMGGGALMTPMLILFFNVDPLTAVSSDLVAAAVMKPVGGAVHLRRGTVHKGLVTWLVIGSVPAAFSGVFVLKALGNEDDTQAVVKAALGVALLAAAGAMIVKALIDLWQSRTPGAGPAVGGEVHVRRVPTLIIGILGGLVVGMTSVGSGSLMIVALLLLYPVLRANQLVGTDLVQAVPLVASASIAHILFGDFQLDLTASLLVGAIPGVYAGARVSSQAPGGIIRRALVVVLLASALKLLEAPNWLVLVVLISVAAFAPLLWMSVYHFSRPHVRARTGLRKIWLAGATGTPLLQKSAAAPPADAEPGEAGTPGDPEGQPVDPR